MRTFAEASVLMFDNLSDKLQRVFKNLRGEGKLTPENMETALREVRVALLEADVHFRVTKRGDDASVRAEVETLANTTRIEELARMLAGSAITTKTRAHAKELLEQHRRAVR